MNTFTFILVRPQAETKRSQSSISRARSLKEQIASADSADVKAASPASASTDSQPSLTTTTEMAARAPALPLK